MDEIRSLPSIRLGSVESWGTGCRYVWPDDRQFLQQLTQRAPAAAALVPLGQPTLIRDYHLRAHMLLRVYNDQRR